MSRRPSSSSARRRGARRETGSVERTHALRRGVARQVPFLPSTRVVASCAGPWDVGQRAVVSHCVSRTKAEGARAPDAVVGHDAIDHDHRRAGQLETLQIERRGDKRLSPSEHEMTRGERASNPSGTITRTLPLSRCRTANVTGGASDVRETFLSVLLAMNATHWPSGESAGSEAYSVPGIGRAAS
jgi:hypothetical protein